MAGDIWLQNEIELVAGLLADGLSAAQISTQLWRLGIRRSKGSVISVVSRNHRLSEIGFARRPGEALSVLNNSVSSVPLPVIDEACSEPRALLELERHDCRFPVSGAGEETLFCGDRVAAPMPGLAGRSYCERHRIRARSVWQGDF